MDPYCGWNDYQMACAAAPNRNPLITFWEQKPIQCPKPNHPGKLLLLDSSYYFFNLLYVNSKTQNGVKY